MLTTNGTVGIVPTGKLDSKVLQGILEALPEGTWELVCHPGYSDADSAAGTRLMKSREIELEALTSAEVKSLISRRKIELISYATFIPDVGKQERICIAGSYLASKWQQGEPV